MPSHPEDPFDQLLARLQRAVDDIELAVERELTRARSRSVLDDEVSMLLADRNRLAEDLDRATSNADRLARSNREVAERLDNAMGMLSGLLQRSEGHEAVVTESLAEGRV
jgi:hypothetical protein